MKRTFLRMLAALVLLMLNHSPGWGQVNPESEQPFIVWYHDWMSDYNFGEIRSCAFNSDESMIAILSYFSAEGPNKTYLGYISFFDVNTGNFIDSIRIFNETRSNDIAFFNDSTLVVGADDKLRFYNINTKQLVRENDYIKNKYSGDNIFSKRLIGKFSLTNDKRYLAASTVHEFVVFDLIADTVVMERAIPDEVFKENPYYNSYVSCKFINKKNTLLVVKGSTLLEFDYQNDTLKSESGLGCHPEYNNFDISDSEDMLTYASWSEESSNNAYIMDLETKKWQKFNTGELKVLYSYFLLNDDYLHLSRTYDGLSTQLYSIKDKRAFFCDIPKSIYVVRAKLSNRFILYGEKILLIDGDLFLTDTPKDEKSQLQLIFPNPGSNEVKINLNILVTGNYKLQITNITGLLIKEKELGFLESGQNQINLEISELKSGVYFLTITSGKQNYYFKLVKE